MKYDSWQDFSLYNGLTGYGRYWMTRLRYQNPSLQARECLSYIAGMIDKHISNVVADDHVDVYCFLSDLLKIGGFENCSRQDIQVKE